VSGEILEDISAPEARTAAARSRAYGAFTQALAYPDGEQCEMIRSGVLANGLREVLEAAAPALVDAADWEALAEAGGEDDLAVEFTRLFDVGASGPPCPLYGGLYGGARMKTMEEAVRFYNHFGLTLAEAPHELPDHLTTELEFLHFLSFREAESLEQGEDPGPYRRAQRDFIERHPGRWVPKLCKKLEQADPMPFFRELMRQLERFLEAERAHLLSLVGPAPAAKSTTLHSSI
jgi:DMSO reductase family type II enzyme chaperone